jgi:hypothetical protein
MRQCQCQPAMLLLLPKLFSSILSLRLRKSCASPAGPPSNAAGPSNKRTCGGRSASRQESRGQRTKISDWQRWFGRAVLDPLAALTDGAPLRCSKPILSELGIGSPGMSSAARRTAGMSNSLLGWPN